MHLNHLQLCRMSAHGHASAILNFWNPISGFGGLLVGTGGAEQSVSVQFVIMLLRGLASTTAHLNRCSKTLQPLQMQVDRKLTFPMFLSLLQINLTKILDMSCSRYATNRSIVRQHPDFFHIPILVMLSWRSSKRESIDQPRINFDDVLTHLPNRFFLYCSLFVYLSWSRSAPGFGGNFRNSEQPPGWHLALYPSMGWFNRSHW